MPDFSIIQADTVIPSGQTNWTLTNGVDYTLESGIASSKWFVIILNSQFTGMGKTSGGGSQNADDVSVHCSVSGNDITFTRAGSSNDCRVAYQIIQYTGAASGPNEITVHEKGVSSNTFSVDASASSNINDVVPFITGQSSTETGTGFYNSIQYTTAYDGTSVDFTPARPTSTNTCSYAIVEFVGSNWTVNREAFTNAQSPHTLASPVAAMANTFTHCQFSYVTTSTVGLDDASARVELTATDTLTVTAQTSTDAAVKQNVIYLVQNPDMTVTRYSGTMNGTGEEEIDNITITPVADLGQTMLAGYTNDSTGAGAAFPRGLINYRMTSVSNVELKQSDNGQTSRYGFEVVDLPSGGAPPAATRNMYHGAGQVGAAYHGGTSVTRVYLGGTVLFDG
jgi:hypothetical protein